MTVLTPTRRGTSNTNSRGPAESRRRRKAWLLSEFGDGTTAECQLRVSPKCEGTVTFETMTVDRYPIPGCEGGRYVKGNTRPACGPCNASDGGMLSARREAAQDALLQTAV